MTSTIEISFYPLNKDYPASVVSFLQKLNSLPDIETKTNGMSTILIGSYDILWPQLGKLMNLQFNEEDCIFVLKVAPGRREYLE